MENSQALMRQYISHLCVAEYGHKYEDDKEITVDNFQVWSDIVNKVYTRYDED
jgi:hypothetical protein